MFSTKIIQTGLQVCEHSISSIEAQLHEMPDISFGRHRRNGKQELIIRYRTQANGKPKPAEITSASPRWSELFPIAQKRAILTDSLTTLKAERSAIFDSLNNRQTMPTSLAPSLLTASSSSQRSEYSYEVWCSLQEANEKNIRNGYAHGRHLFRSKSELLIAQLLEELNLEYKYEVMLTIGGKPRWPDFTVYCPEIGRFFFIEHLGRMDKPTYREDNMEKMEAYEKNRIRNGIDIIYTVEFGEGYFNLDSVYSKIVGLIVAQTFTLMRNANM